MIMGQRELFAGQSDFCAEFCVGAKCISIVISPGVRDRGV
jgi:hypothetical protein